MKQTVDWHSYWTRKKPGFHEAKVNQYLHQYLPLFDLKSQDSIFLPLCGKAYDIHWLAQQGFNVVGVEISAVAIKSFLEEFRLDYEVSAEEHFVVYRAHNITLYQGDFMHMEAGQLAHCKLVYDRASIVAIESFNRESYASQLLKIIPAGIPMLMVTLQYDQHIMSGPPYSVAVAEIKSYFEPSYRVTHLITNEQIDEREKWRQMGLNSFKETALSLLSR